VKIPSFEDKNRKGSDKSDVDRGVRGKVMFKNEIQGDEEYRGEKNIKLFASSKELLVIHPRSIR